MYHFDKITKFIKELYGNREIVPLHEPVFIGNEKKYLSECIDSTYVSYIGAFVNRFEDMIKYFTGSKYAIATVNGTSALHISLLSIGVQAGDEILTQPLTFVATVNAISYCGATPILLDCEKDTLGLSPDSLEYFLENETFVNNNNCYNKKTLRKIAACLPVHVYGHPVRIDKIKNICKHYCITLIEDAAESLGSFYMNKHTGTYGKIGIISFNGNKIITTGGGGMILTDDDELAKILRHLTSTAKISHIYEYDHDNVGYNYRMPNVNAAIGCAQVENLPLFIENKRQLALLYEDFFKTCGIIFFKEKANCHSNYWLNTIIFDNKDQRDSFLEYSNSHGVATRPAWNLMSKLKMYRHCQNDGIENAEWLQNRAVNIPSSVRL